MDYVTLGTTELKVSALALGCMSLTHENEARSRATVIREELGLTEDEPAFYDALEFSSFEGWVSSRCVS